MTVHTLLYALRNSARPTALMSEKQLGLWRQQKPIKLRLLHTVRYLTYLLLL